ncbi:MAG: J domain-containing protein [Bacteroidota bacterium]
MLKILKTIKFLIESKNEEELALEIASLKNFNDKVFLEIIYNIENHQRQAAIELINSYISENAIVKDYHHNTVGLKTFKSLLETKLSVLNIQKIDLEKYLNDFRNQNIEILGGVLKAILSVRVKILKIKSEKVPSSKLDDAIKEQTEFEELYNAKLEKPVIHLNNDEIAEIKKMYRKASKLCHPDLVDGFKKEQARFYFMELNLAYVYGNIDKVRELLSMLDSEQWLSVDYQIGEQGEIEQLIKRLTYEIQKLEGEIRDIKDAPEYKLIKSIDDWAVYFKKLKMKFEKDFDILNEELKLLEADVLISDRNE